MNDLLNQLHQLPDLWQALIQAAVTLILFAIATAAGQQTLRALLHLWRTLRKFRQPVIEAINEPTDPAIVLLAKYAPGLARWVVAYGPFALRTIADALDTQAGIPREPETKSFGNEAVR